MSMTGEVASASLHYIVRDHDASLFEARKNTLRHIEKIMNEKWGEGTVRLTLTEQIPQYGRSGRNLQCT